MWNWLFVAQTHPLAYDQLRYRKHPYHYSVAWCVTSEGYAIMRALPMGFPADKNIWNIRDEYMFAPTLFMRP
jgi:alpha-D-xyloside xylohydrolase